MIKVSRLRRGNVNAEHIARNEVEEMIKVDKCGICFKKLIRGDYVYGACHDCAKRTISQRLKDVKRYANIPYSIRPRQPRLRSE